LLFRSGSLGLGPLQLISLGLDSSHLLFSLRSLGHLSFCSARLLLELSIPPWLQVEVSGPLPRLIPSSRIVPPVDFCPPVQSTSSSPAVVFPSCRQYFGPAVLLLFARRPAPRRILLSAEWLFAAHSGCVCSSYRASGTSDLVLSKPTDLEVGSGGEVATASESLTLRFASVFTSLDRLLDFPCMRVTPSVLLVWFPTSSPS
jgi:hypothetical protein